MDQSIRTYFVNALYSMMRHQAGRKENRLYVAGSVAFLDELFGELKLSYWGGKNPLSKACRQVAPVLTALLAVLDLITLEFSRADPLRRTPLQ